MSHDHPCSLGIQGSVKTVGPTLLSIKLVIDRKNFKVQFKEKQRFICWTAEVELLLNVDYYKAIENPECSQTHICIVYTVKSSLFLVVQVMI